ncbi:hypothetical protein N2152v2_010546 [Parachlorella kessleri]
MTNQSCQEEVQVTPDGGVTKLVLREGSGEVPPKHSRCLVHYTGRLVDSGEVFIDTHDETSGQEPVQLVAGRDSLSREVGLHLAVATMRKGELVRLRVQPQYGYGGKGSFSFPTVPPDAVLDYELELLDWELPNEEREMRLMTYEERVEAAERRRLEGNGLYKEGRLDEALSKYRLALSFMNEDFLLQLEGFHLAKAQAVRLPSLLNMAACQLKQGDYHEAVINCNQVLAEEPQNAKALFRRGRARHQLGQTEAALEDLTKARQAAPSDANIARELQAVRTVIQQEAKAQGQIFKGYFDKAGAPALYEGDAPNAPGGDSEAAAAALSRKAAERSGGPLSSAAGSSWWDTLVGWLQWLLQSLFPAADWKKHAA